MNTLTELVNHIKTYNDEALTNETTTFYVGEKIYYKIFDVFSYTQQ